MQAIVIGIETLEILCMDCLEAVLKYTNDA